MTLSNASVKSVGSPPGPPVTLVPVITQFPTAGQINDPVNTYGATVGVGVGVIVGVKIGVKKNP